MFLPMAFFFDTIVISFLLISTALILLDFYNRINSSRPFKLRYVFYTAYLTAGTVNCDRTNLPIIIVTKATVIVHWIICACLCLTLSWANHLLKRYNNNEISGILCEFWLIKNHFNTIQTKKRKKNFYSLTDIMKDVAFDNADPSSTQDTCHRALFKWVSKVITQLLWFCIATIG